MFADDSLDDDDAYDDCADEGVVLNEPATLLRALIDAEPALPEVKSALWRGLLDCGSLNHRADSLAGLSPEPG